MDSHGARVSDINVQGNMDFQWGVPDINLHLQGNSSSEITLD